VTGQTRVIVVDPGHGGATEVGGSSPNNAIGPNGLLEKELTLDIAYRTVAALRGKARGILTRATDVNRALIDRATVARVNNADAFLSIHLNGFVDPKVDGTEVWVTPTATAKSIYLAKAVLKRLLPVTGAPSRGVHKADLGVLRSSRHSVDTASCLAEIVFLTNPLQAERLVTTVYREQLGHALAMAVLDLGQLPTPLQGSGLPPH
jgi:N-acetylmuramoyl-L-alanine amidase